VRVAVLMVDYDGTIAPIGVHRDESRIFRRVEVQLRRIVKQVPVCIVTAKDFSFIRPRSGFASGWACVSGLDVRAAGGGHITSSKLSGLGAALDLARSFERMGSYTELKHGPQGELLAVAIDWTGVPNLGPSVVRKLRSLARSGAVVTHDRDATFADIYAAQPDKGKATKLLKNLLEIEGNLMFIGDSAQDNAAFQRAEISIGLVHGQPMNELRCKYTVEKDRLAEFLRSLSDRTMDFAPSIPSVRRKRR
jgi:hydroxymethylpyrimidine pyrophosphatase-like HAD family hydrolase